MTHVRGSASDVLIKLRSGSVFIVPSVVGAAETKRVYANIRAVMYYLRNMRNGREILQSLSKTEMRDAEDQAFGGRKYSQLKMGSNYTPKFRSPN